MRRLFVAVVLCTALLLTGAAAAAPPDHIGDGHHKMPAPHASGVEGAPGNASYVPLGTRLSVATTTVYGTVYSSFHYGQSGADVEWDSWSDAEQGWYWGVGTTDATGAYSMSARSTTSGTVWAYPGEAAFARAGRTWSPGGSDQVDFYPGRVQISAFRGGPWNVFTGYTVRLTGNTEYSRGDVDAIDTTSSPVAGSIEAVNGTYEGGSVNFFYDEGVEFSGPITVSSGSTSGTVVSVNEADAQRIWITAPYWWSGKPGATVRLVRNSFPAGWMNVVTGYSDPSGSAAKTYGVKTSQGGSTEPLSVKVPATAKPGYSYWIGFQHVDAAGNELPLYLEEPYQVCTIKPTKTSIRKGTRIKIKGIVPTQDHWGSQLGKRKSVWILWHKGTAAVPTKWNATKQGWVPLARVRTTGTGAYTSPYLKPPRTGTFVVQYDGDDWYYGAFTSVQKVTVR